MRAFQKASLRRSSTRALPAALLRDAFVRSAARLRSATRAAFGSASLWRALPALLLLTACQSDYGQPAPFKADPPPASWSRPEVAATPDVAVAETAPNGGSDAKGPKLAEHVWGNSAWPCTGSPACATPSPADQTLGTSAGSIEYVDPTLVSETEGVLLTTQAFEGLLNPARRSGGPMEQGVAESWELAADDVTYTFHLRADAKWSNGRAVTADDFVYSWMRKLEPATASQGAETLYWIAGAEDFNTGKTKDPSTVAVKALDARTLQVRLRCAATFWPSYLVSGHYLPVPKEAVEKYGDKWTDPANIVTNGAYHITFLEERNRVELVRSETYWDKANVRIPRLVIYHAEGEPKQLVLYEAGQTQWARAAVDPASIPRYIADNRQDFLLDQYLCVYYYMFNTEKPPFDDVRVRRAFSMALDREALVANVSRGMQIPADGPIPSIFDETQAFPGVAGPRFDPEGARELLTEAGYPKGHGFPETKILFNTMETHRLIAEYLAKSLRENLGVSAVAENMEWKSLLKQLRAGEFSLARLGWCGLDSPFSFLEQFTSDSPRNDMRYKNPTYDKLVDDYRCGGGTPAESAAIGAKAEAEVIRDLPILPVYYYTRPYLKLPVLRGLEPHLEDLHLVKYMWWGDTQQPPEPKPMPELVRGPK